MMGSHWETGWMGFGGIWMLLFWALVILGVIAFVKYLWGGPQGDQTRHMDSLQILEERYARGEIDREEFEQRKRDLDG